MRPARSILLLALPILAGCSSPTKSSLEDLYAYRRNAIVAKYTGKRPLARISAPAPDSQAMPEDPTAQADAALALAAEDCTARNELLNDLIFLIDMNYHSSERALNRNKGWADFAGSVTVLGLSAVGTAGTSTAVKTLMNALSGVITGTKTAFDKDVLQNTNILAIITKMRALRAQRLLILRTGMKTKKISDYPLSEGLVDIGEYYQCGNATAALQAIIDTAGAEKKNADDIIDTKIRKIPTL